LSGNVIVNYNKYNEIIFIIYLMKCA
jgi:hypothetical protein